MSEYTDGYTANEMYRQVYISTGVFGDPEINLLFTLQVGQPDVAPDECRAALKAGADAIAASLQESFPAVPLTASTYTRLTGVKALPDAT